MLSSFGRTNFTSPPTAVEPTGTADPVFLWKPYDRAESERPRSPTRFAVEFPPYPVALDPGTADVNWTFMEPSPVNLKLLPFFEDFEWRHLEALSASAISVRFEPAQRIFREGEEANRFYLITAGEVAIETAGPDARPIRVMVLKAGDALGWSWLFPPYFWRFDAVSLTPVDAVYFYGTKLRDAAGEDPVLCCALLKRMSHVILERLQATRLQFAKSQSASLGNRTVE